MSDRASRRAFLLAVLTLAGALGLLAALHPGGRAGGEGRKAADPTRKPAELLPGRPEPIATSGDANRGEGRAGRRPRAKRTRAGAQASQFLAAFLNYQRGVLDLRTRRLLARTATAHVRAYLLRAPPRDPANQTGARIVSLHLYGSSSGALKASAIVAYPRRGERSLFEFALRRDAGAWRVAELYP